MNLLKKNEGYLPFKEVLNTTNLKESVLLEICVNSKLKGLAYKPKDNDWMIHSSVVKGLAIVLNGNKDSQDGFKK